MVKNPVMFHYASFISLLSAHPSLNDPTQPSAAPAIINTTIVTANYANNGLKTSRLRYPHPGTPVTKITQRLRRGGECIASTYCIINRIKMSATE